MPVDGVARDLLVARPVRAEERATHQVDARERGPRPGQVRLTHGVQHGGPVAVGGPRDEDLVEVGEDEQGGAVQRAVEAVVEGGELGEVVHRRDDVAARRPDIDRDGERRPRHDGHESVTTVR